MFKSFDGDVVESGCHGFVRELHAAIRGKYKVRGDKQMNIREDDDENDDAMDGEPSPTGHSEELNESEQEENQLFDELTATVRMLVKSWNGTTGLAPRLRRNKGTRLATTIKNLHAAIAQESQLQDESQLQAGLNVGGLNDLLSVTKTKGDKAGKLHKVPVPQVKLKGNKNKGAKKNNLTHKSFAAAADEEARRKAAAIKKIHDNKDTANEKAYSEMIETDEIAESQAFDSHNDMDMDDDSLCNFIDGQHIKRMNAPELNEELQSRLDDSDRLKPAAPLEPDPEQQPDQEPETQSFEDRVASGCYRVKVSTMPEAAVTVLITRIHELGKNPHHCRGLGQAKLMLRWAARDDALGRWMSSVQDSVGILVHVVGKILG